MIEEMILPAVGTISRYHSSEFGLEIWDYSHVEVSLGEEEWGVFVEMVDGELWRGAPGFYQTVLRYQNEEGEVDIKVIVKRGEYDGCFDVSVAMNSHALSRMDPGLFLEWIAKYN